MTPSCWHLGSLTFAVTGPPNWHSGHWPPHTDIWDYLPPSYWHLRSLTPSYWHLESVTPLLLTFGVTDPPSYWHLGSLTPPTDIWGHWPPSYWHLGSLNPANQFTDLSEDGRLVVALLHVDGDVHLRGLAGQPSVLSCGLRTTQRVSSGR